MALEMRWGGQGGMWMDGGCGFSRAHLRAFAVCRFEMHAEIHPVPEILGLQFLPCPSYFHVSKSGCSFLRRGVIGRVHLITVLTKVDD